ncbi:MAG: DUF4102 domain-containing protein, partial [Gammaproteobacteria bacterium]|nr:DUF4102 domain-containing protein [Gammaproteobacteria bacterium]
MTKSINLTATAISKLKSEKQKYEITDTGAKGLRLRVSPTGWKSFIWRYMAAGKSKVYTIGRFIE